MRRTTEYFTYLSKNNFKIFLNLQVLILDHNPLYMIDPYALSKIDQLKVLSMNDIVQCVVNNSDFLYLSHIPKTTNVKVEWKVKDNNDVGAMFYAYQQ